MSAFTLNNSHFTIISHKSFNRITDKKSFNTKLLSDNSTIIVNCKLIINSEGVA
ncbi:hypothetical protein BH10PAT3_BH10PAT3_3470 [soil metagenome]